MEKNNQKVGKIRHDKRADETTKNKLLEKINLALLVLMVEGWKQKVNASKREDQIVLARKIVT